MSDKAITEVEYKARAAKAASQKLASAGAEAKNKALTLMAEEIGRQKPAILEANQADVAAARDKGLDDYLIDRLTLNDKRIAAMQEGLRQLTALPDPVGQVLSGWKRPNGLEITKVRVPIGVIGMIYESRPNVTVDAASLCIKSGNAVVLRGGSETIRSNIALTKVLQDALGGAGLPRDAVALIESTDRSAARHLMTLNGIVDCLIPRGGASLIKTVVETASVPVIETGTGNCHVYVDESADIEMAIRITVNSKAQRCSVCNSAESLLVHKKVADRFLPAAGKALQKAGVEIRGDERTLQLIQGAKPAVEQDWYEEYLALILAIKVVDDIDEAIAHINRYGTHHTETIVTRDYAASQKFTEAVDSVAVMVNASTRFTDGFEFGFGAEIGISNQKLHARGPIGLEELTTYKYIVRGDGQIRE
jgi:glutamate-5-semialdehyde dehydrogenase